MYERIEKEKYVKINKILYNFRSNIASLLQNTDNISIKATIAFIVKNHMNTHDGSIFRDVRIN